MLADLIAIGLMAATGIYGALADSHHRSRRCTATQGADHA